MLQPFFDFVDKFATDFSWKRLVITVSLVFMSLAVLVLYESQTATFQLSKYERAVAILGKLESLKLENEKSKEVAKNIYDGLTGVTKLSTNPISFTATMPRELKQALLSASPWLLLCLFFIPGYLKGNKVYSSVIGGTIVMALIVGLCGYLIPIEWSPWVALGLYPFGANLLLLTLLFWIGQRKQHKNRS